MSHYTSPSLMFTMSNVFVFVVSLTLSWSLPVEPIEAGHFSLWPCASPDNCKRNKPKEELGYRKSITLQKFAIPCPNSYLPLKSFISLVDLFTSSGGRSLSNRWNQPVDSSPLKEKRGFLGEAGHSHAGGHNPAAREEESSIYSALSESWNFLHNPLVFFVRSDCA